MKLWNFLEKQGACSDGLVWIGDRDLPTAWAECERGDWMLWALGNMAGRPGWPTKQELTLVACWCARRALKHWNRPDDRRPLDTIEAAERWAREPTKENRRAADAAANAADAAAWDASDAAARAISWAASRAAANAAGNSAWAAAWAAAWDADRDADRDASDAARAAAELKAQAKHIRKTLKIGELT